MSKPGEGMTGIPTTARDIVERLRDMPNIPERRNRLRDEAADEIERLRARVLELEDENSHLNIQVGLLAEEVLQ